MEGKSNEALRQRILLELTFLRSRMPTTGATKRGSRAAGSHKTRRIECIRTFAHDVQRLKHACNLLSTHATLHITIPRLRTTLSDIS